MNAIDVGDGVSIEVMDKLVNIIDRGSLILQLEVKDIRTICTSLGGKFTMPRQKKRIRDTSTIDIEEYIQSLECSR